MYVHMQTVTIVAILPVRANTIVTQVSLHWE